MSLITGLIVLLVSGSGLAYADGDVALSGRVYNGVTGAGYSGVGLDLCAAGAVKTDDEGNWQLVVPAGTTYCVRLAEGAPAGTPLTRNNPEVANQASYEHQVAGVTCYHKPDCDADSQTWDRATDGGLDFAYGLASAQAAASPTPAATATPAAKHPAAPPANRYGWLNYAAAGVVVAVAAGFLLFAPLQSGRKRSYREYIQSKYYNL